MEKKSEEVPIIVAQTGPLNGQRWALINRAIVGREQSCDIVIADRQVSRQHASFTPTPKGVLLEDLESKNGTHHNGQPLDKPILLQDGDIIQIALAQQFVYLSSDATLPLEADDIDLGSFRTDWLRLEKRSRRVWIGDQEVLPPLSVSQFKLLEILYEHQGRVVPRNDLITIVWGEEQAIVVSEQALDALVRRLRDRLASIDATHAYIVTVRGHGLRLDNPPSNYG
jgi:pSer/pThr/pTyr-binding forkhead associated (FHA) protein